VGIQIPFDMGVSLRCCVRDGASGQSVCGGSENAGASPVRARAYSVTHNMFQKQETRLVEVVVD
jgi:hypothetical protein